MNAALPKLPVVVAAHVFMMRCARTRKDLITATVGFTGQVKIVTEVRHHGSAIVVFSCYIYILLVGPRLLVGFILKG